MSGKKKEFFVTVADNSNEKRQALLSALSMQMVFDDARIRKGHYLITLESLGNDYKKALEKSGFTTEYEIGE